MSKKSISVINEFHIESHANWRRSAMAGNVNPSFLLDFPGLGMEKNTQDPKLMDLSRFGAVVRVKTRDSSGATYFEGQISLWVVDGYSKNLSENILQTITAPNLRSAVCQVYTYLASELNALESADSMERDLYIDKPKDL